MYNSQIIKLINQNLTLNSVAANLIKDFEQTSDIVSLERAEEIQEEISKNHRRIKRMRGEN